MNENGQLNRWTKKWGSKFNQVQDCNSSDEAKPLAIRDVFVVFIMLLGAMAVTLLLVQLEKIHARFAA